VQCEIDVDVVAAAVTASPSSSTTTAAAATAIPSGKVAHVAIKHQCGVRERARISEPSPTSRWPGRQCIAGDVVRPQLLRQHFREVVDAGLGRGVERPPVGGMASGGRDVNDLAALALSHPCDSALG
jgi:hypothetical protein